ncbi:MAG: T9SS type A sorting domain-containing protein [Chitinophagaceae bacterium]|nr:MAG: T9SS type A sorting domain-containing protein [Chitinophagaceae bacterium]
MKQIFTLILAGILCHATNAQLLLNEVYTDPGSGNQEFFEVYNPDIAAEETDNYSLVTFYKSQTQKGFYVLDLPAGTVSGKGYFVGSAASPFNYQGVTNSTNTVFNWNDPAWLQTHNGSLTKWKLTTTGKDATDGNIDYEANKNPFINDLFTRLNGSGSSFVIFLYKNGVMVNSTLLGSGGASALSADILAMPPLFVDMQGSSPDFTIDFSTYGNLPVENVNQEAGSDNGFIRDFDGACGSWTKSSAQVNHTPLATNGQMNMYATGSVSVTASIVLGNESAGSILTYNVGSTSASLFPLQLNIYVDKGSMLNQLDIGDSLLTTQVVTTTNSNYTLNFKPYIDNIIIVVKTSVKCVDKMKLVNNIFMSTLPVKLLNFNASHQQDKALFAWSVANNEDGNYYELQSSANGTDFQTMEIIPNTTKHGTETYSYKDGKVSDGDNYYRLKMVDKSNQVSYSNVLYAGSRKETVNTIQLLQNPAASQLVFSSNSESDNKATLAIYNMQGVKVYAAPVQLKKGKQANTISLQSNISPGTYLLEVAGAKDRTTVKFIKN